MISAEIALKKKKNLKQSSSHTPQDLLFPKPFPEPPSNM